MDLLLWAKYTCIISYNVHSGSSRPVLFYPCTGTPPFSALHFTALHRGCVVLQIEGKTLRQQKDYNLLYCNTLLQWSGTEPQYLRGLPVYAYRYFINSLGPKGGI